MRRPPDPPDLVDVLDAMTRENLVGFFNRQLDSDVIEFVRMCNDSYLHWHKLRYHPLPDGLSREQAWALVELNRNNQRVSLPITFEDRELTCWTPPKQVQWLHKIDQRGGGNLGIRHPVPPDRRQREKYLVNSLMEEAIASSQLEGAATTRKKAKEMLRTNRRPKSRAEKMILNNYKAILEIRDLKSQSLTPELLLHLQETLTEDTLDDSSAAGRFRTAADNVVVIDSHTEEVLHTPPPASGLDYRLEEICDFANEHPSPFVHPVIRAIILHFAIGYVHPFVDGNGRTARAVFYWLMLKEGYWLFEFLPISRIFLGAPSKYARAYLYTETDHGDATHFVHYHLNVINRAIRDLQEYIERQQESAMEAVGIIRECPSVNQRQATLLYHALKHPNAAYTISEYRGANGIGYATARADLLDLSEKRFLRKEMNGKAFVFMPESDLLERLRSNKQDIPDREDDNDMPLFPEG